MLMSMAEGIAGYQDELVRETSAQASAVGSAAGCPKLRPTWSNWLKLESRVLLAETLVAVMPLSAADPADYSHFWEEGGAGVAAQSNILRVS